MASQFQNRVVGAVVLVALAVIILPGVLDGDKLHYQSDFAAIPLIPTPEDTNPTNVLPSVTEPIPDPVIPEPVVDSNNANATATEINVSGASSGAQPVNPPVPPQPAGPATGNKPQQAPKGKAYVIQLGALTNAAKVEEIKATLSFANYTVFTVPTTAVQGKTTRIFVGPEASRQRLEASLPALEKLTGLKGVVREHKVTN